MNVFYTQDIISLISITASLVSIIAFVFLMINVSDSRREEKSVEKAVEKIANDVSFNDFSEITSIMIKNVTELREYYTISKRHSTKTFFASLLACILGVAVYIAGIIVMAITDNNIVLYTTVAGTFTECISATFFWLYKRSIEQLNLYHRRLSQTEKYLFSIGLIARMSEGLRDEAYKHVMESVLIDNRLQSNEDGKVKKEEKTEATDTRNKE